MRMELQEKLINEFPIYNIEEGNGPFSLNGFEVGDGWFDLIWELSEKVQAAVNNLNDDNQNFFSVLQVKEKYGQLTYYTFISNEKIQEAVREAEEKSLVTCEVCGEPGKINGKGWLSVRCEKHLK